MVCVGGTDDDALNEHRPGLFSPGPHLLCGVAGNRTRHRIGPCPQWLDDLDVSAKSPPPPSTCSRSGHWAPPNNHAQASENSWHAGFPAAAAPRKHDHVPPTIAPDNASAPTHPLSDSSVRERREAPTSSFTPHAEIHSSSRPSEGLSTDGDRHTAHRTEAITRHSARAT